MRDQKETRICDTFNWLLDEIQSDIEMYESQRRITSC